MSIKSRKITNPTHTGIKDMYRYYKQDYSNVWICPYSTYYKIIYEFNKNLVKAIIENSQVIRLPLRLGLLFIQKQKQVIDPVKGRKMTIDWVSSRKAGQRVFFTNEHTDGHVYKWKWYKKGSNTKNISFYIFKPARCNKRKITQMLKKGIDYFTKV